MDKITTARVLDIIAAYGAEPEAWPDAERDACATAIAGAPNVFADALEEALALDARVAQDILSSPLPSEALIASIIASAPTGKSAAPMGGFLAKLRGAILPQGQRWPAMAAAASLMIGLGFGMNLSVPATSDAVTDDDIVYAAFGLSDYSTGFEELN